MNQNSGRLERLQILTEVVREFKTAILNDIEAKKTGQLVLEVMQSAGDAWLSDQILHAYTSLNNVPVATYYLDEATRYLHNEIDTCLNNS